MTITNLTEKREQRQRTEYRVAVLDAWDRIHPDEREAKQIGRPQRLDTDPEVRRKAKQRL